jgi:hypothetical protein
MAGEIMEITLSAYNDIWKDNAVENFYRLIEDSGEEIDINLDKTKLTINTKNKKELENFLSILFN